MLLLMFPRGEMKKPSFEMIQKLLDGLFEAAMDGLPGQPTAAELAAEYRATPGTLEQQTTRFIRWQVAKCATSGFLTGLGGLITLPVTVPADLAANWYVQMRMVAVVALMHGHAVREDRVRSLVYLCLVGSALNEVARNVGIKIGEHFGKQLIQRVSVETVRAINKAVGVRLVTKFGERGLFNLGKMIPIVGGIIGAGFDGVACVAVGKAARIVFANGQDAK